MIRVLVIVLFLTGCSQYDCTGKVDAYERQVKECMEVRPGAVPENYAYCVSHARKICEVSE